MGISLDGIRMNAVETAPNGVVDKDTVFIFHQEEDTVTAEYSGGKISKGYLVGKFKDGVLEFRYAQIQTDGTLDGGASRCEVETKGDGAIEIIEKFEWDSRDGYGKNVFRELPA